MLSIDRFEEGYAVCIDEDGRVINITVELVEDDAKEGDVIFFEDGMYHVSEEATQAVRDEILALQDELFE